MRRRVATVGAVTGAGWLGAVVIMMGILAQPLGEGLWQARVATVLVAIVGLTLFVVPIANVQRALQELKIELLSAMMHNLRSDPGPVRHEVEVFAKELVDSAEHGRPDAAAAVASETTWIVTPSALLTNVTAIVLPLLSIWIS